jgi:Nitronate monooxygenase
MAIATRLTERLGIAHPVLCAPMDVIAGGKLAAAVSSAGGLGFLGGGYCDDAGWFEREFAAAGNQAVGCGFITWALRKQPQLLDAALARKPKAIFLSFDDPEPFASRIKAAGIPVICQLQTRADAERAMPASPTSSSARAWASSTPSSRPASSWSAWYGRPRSCWAMRAEWCTRREVGTSADTPVLRRPDDGGRGRN